MPTAPRKAAVRFQERSELLDFLLEVAAATSETLDLDQLLANVAGHRRQDVLPYDLFAILLYNDKRQACASATPSAIAKRWSAIS